MKAMSRMHDLNEKKVYDLENKLFWVHISVFCDLIWIIFIVYVERTMNKIRPAALIQTKCSVCEKIFLSVVLFRRFSFSYLK